MKYTFSGWSYTPCSLVIYIYEYIHTYIYTHVSPICSQLFLALLNPQNSNKMSTLGLQQYGDIILYPPKEGLTLPQILMFSPISAIIHNNISIFNQLNHLFFSVQLLESAIFCHSRESKPLQVPPSPSKSHSSHGRLHYGRHERCRQLRSFVASSRVFP